MKKELEWFAIIHDVNGQKFEKYNVFRNLNIMPGLYRIKNEYKKARKEFLEKNGQFLVAEKLNKWEEEYKTEIFSEEVRKLFMWQYWSRCEYENILTTWPTYMTDKQVENLNQEVQKESKRGFYEVDLELEKKFDVYDQLLLNWNHFIDYVWNNLDLIKKTFD